MGTNCLILSNGPPPTPEHMQVEGGGLRCWGLAQGIKTNSPDIEVTLAYNEQYRLPTAFTREWQGIEIRTWRLENVEGLLHGFDSILVSFCMNELSAKVADAIRPNQQLILDCYVPIYTEVSARNSAQPSQEYLAFQRDIRFWNKCLRRGDVFLCASSTQRDYYRGVLSAVGRINPATYDQDLLLTVPFGISREPPYATARPITSQVGSDIHRLLWFGGIYPWFDLSNLLDALRLVNQELDCVLFIVGARNPFNDHPDFIRSFEQTYRSAANHSANGLVHFEAWAPFHERANWFLDSELVILINKPGEENRLAWRTRLIDYVWAELPVLTNGGDSLGEVLLQRGAAFRVDGLEPETMARAIRGALMDTNAQLHARRALHDLKPEFYWDVITADLTRFVQERVRARDLVLYGGAEIINSRQVVPLGIGDIATRVGQFYQHAKSYGITSAVAFSTKVLSGQFSLLRPTSTGPGRLVLISHQLNLSGAPMVAIEIAKEIHQTLPKLPVMFVTYLPVHRDNVRKLNEVGIRPRVFPIDDVAPDFRDNDVVLLNSLAHSQYLKDSVYGRLDRRTLRKVIWYAHEDEPERFFTAPERLRVSRLLQSSRLRIVVPGRQMLRKYCEFFNTESGITYLPYRIDVPSDIRGARDPRDFSSCLRFVMSGTMNDGRKGQLPIFYAFALLIERFIRESKDDYRDFTLTYIGIEDDFLSRQIENHASALRGRLISHPTLSHAETLHVLGQANMTVCYSLSEALPISVYEGMLCGHPLLRNECSGFEEQLEVGRNGWLLDSSDLWQVVSTIETVLNRSKTSDEALAAMSLRSLEIASAQEHVRYLRELGRDFKHLVAPQD